MKKYLYLLTTALIPLYAWTCQKQPTRYTNRPLKVLRFDCPDTVDIATVFEFSFQVRVADCERVIWTSNNMGKDTSNFRLLAEKEQFAKRCDTSQPFTTRGMQHAFFTRGTRYFVLGEGSYRYVDSIYVK